MKKIMFYSIIIGQLLISSCGEDSNDSVIIGTWLGTNIVRRDCPDINFNGQLVCENDLSQCTSCIELVLNQSGTYSLSANFDSAFGFENGEYEGKNNVITLKPDDSESYDLPISNVSETSMEIELSLSNGCIADIVLKKSGC